MSVFSVVSRIPIDSRDTDEMYRILNEEASDKGVHSGVPIALILNAHNPIFGEVCRLSDSYIRSLRESGMFTKIEEVKIDGEITTNEWVRHKSWTVSRSWKGKFGTVIVWKNKITGLFQKDFHPKEMSQDRLDILSTTLSYLITFGIEEAEIKARSKLESMLSPIQKISLVLSDSFCEVGKSGIIYLLRKNRPTLAIRSYKYSEKALCSLCLHPIGWYADSFAGMMAPSDDMIAHLAMIRASEHLFWRKSNQHSIDSYTSGV